jgi:3-oxoacyl-[acyl-carrier protein] reductase
MVDQIQKEFGRIDILVNNAGFTRFIQHSDLEAMNEEIWDRIMHVNLKGAFFCCRAVAPQMKKQGGGRIINVASVAGLTGQGSSIAYCASKAGMISITKSLARALAPEICVNAIAPGLIDTRWLDGVEGADSIRERFQNAALLKRVGTPEDIAEVAVSLAVDWSFVTGQVIVVDGGRTL